MINEQALIIALVIIFLIVFIMRVRESHQAKYGNNRETFLTCYHLCKGKDQWACGRKCDFIQSLYDGDDMAFMKRRFSHLY